MKKNPALLPSGFADLLPPEAGQEAAAIAHLIATFESFGYGRVTPPLLEFEDSLFAGAGAAVADETFRVMDPVSHRMMGLRSDITPQIGRIASSRLSKEPRPLRLCYANSVLRTKAGQQRTERQFTQVGCEIIGNKNAEADIESCVVALIALFELGIKNITLDLACPPLLEILFDQYKISEELRVVVRQGLARKSPDTLKKLPKKLSEILKGLMATAGPAETTLVNIKKMKLPASAKAQLVQVEKIHAGVLRALKQLSLDVTLTVDPLEMRGFKYYSGMGFTLFTRGVAGALGRGGHYDISFGGQKAGESASGFTLYMDSVRKAMAPAKKKKVIQVGYAESWAKIREHQQKGAVVVRGARK